MAHRVPRASPMRAASGCLPPAVRIIPQYVPGLQPRFGACCQSRAIYYQQKPTMRRIVLRRYSARAPRSGLRLRLASRGTLAEPFGRRRIVGHEPGSRRTRTNTNRSSVLCPAIPSPTSHMSPMSPCTGTRDHEPFQPAVRGNPQQAVFVFFRVGGSPAFVSRSICDKPKAETLRRGTAKVVRLDSKVKRLKG